MKNNRKWARWVCLLIGLAAYTLFSGRFCVSFTPWIWPFCLLFFLRSSPRTSSVALACGLFAVCAAIKVYGVFALPAADILVGLLIGVINFLPFWIDRRISHRLCGIKRTLVLPSAYAAIEVAESVLPFGVVHSVSSTQSANPALVQIASVFGSYGVTFLVIWFASALYELLSAERSVRRNAVGCFACYAVTLCAVLVFGMIRLGTTAQTAPQLSVAMTTGPYVGTLGDFYEECLPFERNVASMRQAAKAAADGSADILLFCEEAFSIEDGDEARFIAEAQDAARENAMPMILAEEVSDNNGDHEGRSDNKLLYIDAEGVVVWTYYKNKLVPVVETTSITQGYDAVPLFLCKTKDGAAAELASLICMDADFPQYVRSGLSSNTDILLIPTWDWDAIRIYHAEWTVLRAVENGVALVRSTADGISLAADYCGRILMSSDIRDVGWESVVFASVPIQGVQTVYHAVGAVMDLLFPVLFGVLWGMSRLQRQRRSSKQ